MAKKQKKAEPVQFSAADFANLLTLTGNATIEAKDAQVVVMLQTKLRIAIQQMQQFEKELAEKEAAVPATPPNRAARRAKPKKKR